MFSLPQPWVRRSEHYGSVLPSLITVNGFGSHFGGGRDNEVTGKMSTPGGRSRQSRRSSWGWLTAWFSRGWWTGLGVMLATVGTVIGLILSSGGSSIYSIHGSCNAQGSGNTVICSGADTKTGR